jgi:hypothetical protein
MHAVSEVTYEASTRELERVLKASESVSIRWDRVDAFARTLTATPGGELGDSPPWAAPLTYQDEFPLSNDLSTIQFFFVAVPQGYDHYVMRPGRAVEMWQLRVSGKVRVGVHGLYAGIVRALERGFDLLDARVLAGVSTDDVREIFQDESTGVTSIGDLDGRRDRWHELGQGLLTHYSGSFANLLARAGGHVYREDGEGVVQQLVRTFPLAYGDWPYGKFAITPSRMLADRLDAGIASTPEFRRLATIRDPEHLDAGADATRPFALIRLGILDVHGALRAHLTRSEQIGFGTPEHNALRAAAILACRRLTEESGWPPQRLASELWTTGAFRCPSCKPRKPASPDWSCPHTDTCAAYNDEPERFAVQHPAGTHD